MQSARPACISRIASSPCLRADHLRLRRIARQQHIGQRTDQRHHADVRLVQILPGARSEAAAGDIAERMHVVGVGETDRQRALRRRVQRERQIDLVRLQVEHRVGVGGLDVFQLGVERRGDALRHVDRDAGPFAGGEVLVEERHLAGQRRDAQHAGAADAVERRFARRPSVPPRCRRRRWGRAKRGPKPASCLHDQPPLLL